MNNTINSMTAQGAANQTIGLQWGWPSLLQQSPLNAPSEDPNNIYQHVIVLFTDGLNTQNRWTGDGEAGFARTKKLMQVGGDGTSRRKSFRRGVAARFNIVKCYA